MQSIELPQNGMESAPAQQAGDYIREILYKYDRQDPSYSPVNVRVSDAYATATQDSKTMLPQGRIELPPEMESGQRFDIGLKTTLKVDNIIAQDEGAALRINGNADRLEQGNPTTMNNFNVIIAHISRHTNNRPARRAERILFDKFIKELQVAKAVQDLLYLYTKQPSEHEFI